jgi:hypothetical protein
MTSPLQQKIRINGPIVVTANRLSDGVVIYRTADNRWTTQIAAAAVVTTVPAATELLHAAIADDISAVGAYIAPVEVDAGRIRPGNMRERIRLQGPTFDLPATFGI